MVPLCGYAQLLLCVFVAARWASEGTKVRKRARQRRRRRIWVESETSETATRNRQQTPFSRTTLACVARGPQHPPRRFHTPDAPLVIVPAAHERRFPPRPRCPGQGGMHAHAYPMAMGPGRARHAGYERGTLPRSRARSSARGRGISRQQSPRWGKRLMMCVKNRLNALPSLDQSTLTGN